MSPQNENDTAHESDDSSGTFHRDRYSVSVDEDDSGESTFRNKWPVFMKETEFPSQTTSIANMLLSANSSDICDSVPLQCDEDYTFLVDINKLGSVKDIACDDNGKYKYGT